jgi:hypothetical protein
MFVKETGRREVIKYLLLLCYPTCKVLVDLFEFSYARDEVGVRRSQVCQYVSRHTTVTPISVG